MSDSLELKSGEVYVRKGILNKKSKKWVVLCLGNGENVGSIHLYDNKEQYETNDVKHKPKIYSFEGISEEDIDKVAKSSTKEFYIELPLKKEKITLQFESKEDVEDWHVGISQLLNFASISEGDYTLRENTLYQSSQRDPANHVFEVTIIETEDSIKHDLSGNYKMHVSITSLAIEDKETKQIVCRWHYEFIRRYGLTKSSNIFTIMAGSKCDTGVGKFEFEILGNPKNLTKAIDFHLSQKTAGAGNVTSKLGLEKQLSVKEKEKDRAESPKTSKRNTETPLESKKQLSVNIDKNSNENFTPVVQTPSTLTDNFRQELEEQVLHTPKSPDRDSKTRSSRDKKMFANIFKKKEKSDKKDSKGKGSNRSSSRKEHLYDEPSRPSSFSDQKSTEPLYDEAESNMVRKSSNSTGGNSQFYDEAVTGRKEAWQNFGRSGETHEENYHRIKQAAIQNEGKNIRLTHYDDDEEDETYDRVILDPKKSVITVSDKTKNQEHIYGTASGKLISEIQDDDDYATAEYPSEPNKHLPPRDSYAEDLYDDTALPSTEYTDAVSIMQIKKPVTQLYEEVG